MNIVRRARLAAGFSQAELATRAGMPQSSLARIESGRVSPRLSTVVRLLAECGMRLEAQPIAGEGVDRSTIRRMLALTPAERLEVATREARALSELRPARVRR